MSDRTAKIHHTDKEIVRYCYDQLPNYRIEENESDSDLCAVYFSSNGVDFMCKNDEDFKRVMIGKNRFEWAKNTIRRARKHIFIRDVFKEFYVEGINLKLNTCDKVFAFLKAETKGMRTVTVGSSSGGYAAVLFGILLDAEYVVSFTGQFSLYHISLQSNPRHDPMHNPLLYKHLHDPAYRKYYHLPELMRESSTPIIYLASNHRLDYMQKHLVKSFYNVYAFDIKGEDHVFPCYKFNLGDVLNMPLKDLKELSERYRGRTIGRFRFSMHVSGLWKSIRGWWRIKTHPVSLER